MMSMQSEHQFLVPTGHLYMPMDEQLLLVKGGGGGGAAAGAGKAGEKKRRFTEEQTRSLESMFHAHRARLEPREKAELARELGLQPRQVAIWFQNKRARWRSKQLEQDYAALRAQYDGLRARVDALKQEKLALSAQLQELSEKMKEREGKDGGSSASTSSNGEEVEDKRNIGCVMEQDSVLDCVTPADLSVESECDDHLDYGGTFPETFCATPELWEPWPLVEWNVVA